MDSLTPLHGLGLLHSLRGIAKAQGYRARRQTRDTPLFTDNPMYSITRKDMHKINTTWRTMTKAAHRISTRQLKNQDNKPRIRVIDESYVLIAGTNTYLLP
jgi:hypothetical protein